MGLSWELSQDFPGLLLRFSGNVLMCCLLLRGDQWTLRSQILQVNQLESVCCKWGSNKRGCLQTQTIANNACADKRECQTL